MIHLPRALTVLLAPLLFAPLEGRSDAPTPAHNFRFTTDKTSTTEYTTLALAEDALQQSQGSVTNALKASRSGDKAVGQTYQRFYKANPTDQDPTFGSFGNFSWAVSTLPWEAAHGLASEAAAVQGAITYLNSSHGCSSSAGSGSATTGWLYIAPWQDVWEASGLYGDPVVPLADGTDAVKIYSISYRTGASCSPATGGTRISAHRNISCPPGYVVQGEGLNQANCHNDTTGWIAELNLHGDQPNHVCVGDPCDIATGAQVETFVDYEAPGIRFVRTWRSNVAPLVAYAGQSAPCASISCVPIALAVLPYGWTHSYAMRIFFDSSNKLSMMFRPNGTLASVFETSPGSNIYMTRDGSGVQAIGTSSTDVAVYLPDGSKELYKYYSCAGFPVNRGHRLEQLIDSAGRITQLQYSSGCPSAIGRPPTRVVGPFGHTLDIEYATYPSPPDPDAPFIRRLRDATNHTIEFSYSFRTIGSRGEKLLGQVAYQDGKTVQYRYEDTAAERIAFLTGVVDERGARYATFAYDSQGRTTLTTQAGDFNKWTLAYNTDGTTTATDGRSPSASTTFSFQSGIGSGRIVGSKARSGAAASMANETSGQYRLVTATDERNVTTAYAYDTYHELSSTEAWGTPNARTIVYTYLNSTSQLKRTEKRPSVCSDGTPRLAVIDTQYLPTTQLPQSRTETGFVKNGSTCNQIVRTTSFEYGISNSFERANGLVTAVRGPRGGDDVTFTYNRNCANGFGCGQPATMTNAAGHQWTFTNYDAHGRLGQIIQPNGAVLNYTYDLRGRTTRIEEVAGATSSPTQYDYYDNGLLYKVTDPTGAFIQYGYNDAHLVTSVRDRSGNRIEYGYDAAENRTSETIYDANDVVTASKGTTYDAFNHVDTVLLPNPVSGSDVWNYDYDPTGLLTHVVSPEGHGTTNSYDSLRRLDTVLNALGQETTYVYDAADNVQSVTALKSLAYSWPGVVTSYLYDDFGRLVREDSPDRGVINHEYDEADNLTLTQDARGLSTDYIYDSLSRLRTIQVEPQGGGTQETLSIVYDDVSSGGKKGRISQMSAQNTALTYTYDYDAFGRQTTEQLTSTSLGSPISALTQYSYDLAGRITDIHHGTPTQPNIWVSHSTRDTAGAITSVEDVRSPTTPRNIVSGILHAPFGPYTHMDYRNGFAVTRELDQRYRVRNSHTPRVYRFLLTWTPDDNLDSAAVARAPAGPLGPYDLYTYEHDPLDRTWRVQRDVFTSGIAYHGSGGAYSRSASMEEAGLDYEYYTYNAGSSKIASIQYFDGNYYALNHDGSGNLLDTFALPLAHQYDSLSQMRVLTSKSNHSDVRARYDYNAFAERGQKRTYSGGTTTSTLFSYLPDSKLLGETIFNNSVLAEQRDYVWMDQTPVAMQVTKFNGSGSVTANQIYYLHTDHLDSPQRATDASGHTDVWDWLSMNLYTGESMSGDGYVMNGVNAPISPINLRFAGQYFDSEAGINYNLHRHYWPHEGRYVQPDPIGLAGGLNTYLYAEGNPLRYGDPSGLDTRAEPGPCIFPCWPFPPPTERPPGGWMEEEWLKNLLGGLPAFECVNVGGPGCIPIPVRNEGGDDNGEVCPTPDTHPGDFVKLKGGQGQRDKDGLFWNKDKLHKDHWDVTDRRGNKVKEVDFGGRQIWPGGPKNKNKAPR